jgi:hypothetical protein
MNYMEINTLGTNYIIKNNTVKDLKTKSRIDIFLNSE